MPFSTISGRTEVSKRYLISIAFAAVAIIVSAYAFFLLRHILIIFPADHILPITVAIEISLLVPMWIVLLLGYAKGESSVLPLAGVILILWLIPQVSFIACVESDYGSVEDEYSVFASGRIQNGEDLSATAWNISKKYLQDFSSSQNDIRNPVPVRSVTPENGVYHFHLLLYHYLFAMDGLEKLTTIDARGNCSEYARAVSSLVNRTLGVPSRFVILYGYDHKFVEIKIDDGWLILDPLKTTPYPVRAEDFAGHLQESEPEIYEQVTGISSEEGEDLYSAHGFE